MNKFGSLLGRILKKIRLILGLLIGVMLSLFAMRQLLGHLVPVLTGSITYSIPEDHYFTDLALFLTFDAFLLSVLFYLHGLGAVLVNNGLCTLFDNREVGLIRYKSFSVIAVYKGAINKFFLSYSLACLCLVGTWWFIR